MNLWNKYTNSSPANSESFNLVETFLGLGLFLSPFFFLPFTADYIEINKAYLLMLIAVSSFVAFAFQGYKKGSLYIKSLNYYFPFLILLIAGVVSVYFSQNVRNSLFGSFGNYLNSFLVLTAYCLIAFVAVNVRLKVRSLINYFLMGWVVLVLVAFAGFYSAFLPLLAKFLPTIILAESYTSFLAMLVFTAGVSLYLVFFDKKEGKGMNVVPYAALILSLIYLAVNPDLFSSIALALIVGYFALTQKDFDFNKNIIGITTLAVIVAVVGVMHHVGPVKEAIGFNGITTYPRLDLVSSWYVGATSIVEQPFWGVGLNNYPSAFSKFRPAYLNAGNYWNVRYVYPFNDVFTWLTTGGLIGLGAYLLFMYFVVSKALSKRDLEARDPLLNVATIILVISLFFLGSSLPLYLMLFVFAGALFQNNRGSVFALKTTSSLLASLIMSVAVFGLFIFQAYGVYAAQYYLRQSFLSANLLDRYSLQRLALGRNTIEPNLYREAILTNLAIATRLAAEKDLTDEQKKNVENLLTQAMNDAAVLTEALDPLSASNWEIRGLLNKSLMGLDGEDKRFSNVAVQSYLNAINRDPTNPELRISLGNIYYQHKDYNSAANYFIQAIQLKNDYANSYYNLAYTLKDAGDYTNALTQMRIVERLLPADSQDANLKAQAEQVKKDIEELTKLAADQQAKAGTATNANGVTIPEGVSNPNIKEGPADATQTLVGPEEDASLQLKTDEQLDVQPVNVKEDQNVNLNDEDLQQTSTQEGE
jgi:tetratricopeptide (TPR) repeat protein